LDSLCEQYRIPSYKFKNINEEENIRKIKEYQPDYVFVIGLSQIISEELISIPTKGCIGAHPSLLPIGRGRASIPWAILNDQQETGMSIFYIDKGVDSGHIISQSIVPIESRENAQSLYRKLISSLREQIKRISPNIKNGTLDGVPQNDLIATYTAKRTLEDGLINWMESNERIDRLIRATSKPYPGAYTYYKDKELIIWSSNLINHNKYIGTPGQIVKINKNKSVLVSTGNGLLEILDVSYEGQDYQSFEVLKREGEKLRLTIQKNS
jgi:methionyl-tRNA formyltransferase